MSRPDTVVRIAFDLAAGGVGDFFTLDDPVKGVLDGPVRTNLARNPSFESNTTGWVGGNATVATSTVWSQFGSNSIRIRPSGTSSDTSVQLQPDSLSGTNVVSILEPGQTYTISAWVHVPTAQSGTLNARARSIRLFHRVGLGSFSEFGSSAGATTGTTRVSLTRTIPADVTEVIVRLYNGATNSATNDVHWDGVLIEQADALGDYFDGDVLDASGVSYTLEWTGTANNSTSTATPNAGLGLAGDILQDVTEDVRSVTVRRGRSRELERYQAGAATVNLDNQGRKYDPAAGTAITPYGASMRPRKAVQITTAGVAVFNGVVDDWDLDYSLQGDHVASVKVTDGFVFLAGQEIEPHTTTAQTTGERVTAILDRAEIDWPAGKRAIDTGSATLQADAIGGTADPKPVGALAYLQKVDEAEQGALFIGSNGSLTFRGRSSLQVLTDVVFADDGTGIPFTNINAQYGSEELRNRITVTRLNGGTAVAQDATSIADYGAIDYELRDTLLSTDTQAQSLADAILARYKEPLLRIDDIEVALAAIPAEQVADVLGLELGALVRVLYTPSGIGDAIDQFVRLDAVEHTITAADHRVRLSFSQGEPPALVLDSLLFGLLDINTLGF
jgi:hypothetical protein